MRCRRPVAAVVRVAWYLVAGTVFSTVPAALVAQSAAIDSADALRRRADMLARIGARDSLREATRALTLAAAMYERAGVPAKQRESLSSAALAFTNLGMSDSAFEFLSRARRVAEVQRDDAALAEVVRRTAQAYYALGRFDTAFVLTEQALMLARRVHATIEEGLNLNNLGLLHRELGRLDSSLVALHASYAIRRALNDSVGIGVTLNNLSQTQQSLGRPDSAISYLRSAFAIWEATRDRPRQALALNNIAFNFELLSAPDSADAYYRRAITMLADGGRRSLYGLALANMGRVQLSIGAQDSAYRYLHQGLVIAREVKDRSYEIWPLVDLGRYHRARGNHVAALAYLDSALLLSRAIGAREREGLTLGLIAETNTKYGGEQGLARAVAYYDSAARVRAAVGRTAGADADRLSFAEQDVNLFEGWALAWLARARTEGDERSAFAALAASERGRAQALLDLVRATRRERMGTGSPVFRADSMVRATSSPTDDLVAEGRAIALSVSRTGSAALAYVVSSDTLVVWMLTPDGHVRVSRYAVAKDTIAMLVATVRAGFGVDDAGLAGAGVRAIELPPEFGSAIFRRGVRHAAAPAARLAEMLVPHEFLKELRTGMDVIVIPQGPLTLLPFAALPLGNVSDASGPFGSSFAIRYAPSLRSLAEAEALPRQTVTSGRALIVGNPAMPTVTDASGRPQRLTPLPGASVEAAWVARRLRTVPLDGAAAQESVVMARLPAAPLIHLATHGYAFATEAMARRSFVALAPGAGRDGMLTVGELLDSGIRLRAELVVLSACRSGLGDIKAAEGTVGLQRAFLAIGARSVLVSLWSVGDIATEALMKSFYTHWLGDADHPSKANALVRAQNDVRRMPGFDHPRFWAGFQLVGAA